ncbi:MAG: hypothetical protein KTR31_33665 [Myxococcales bacterium]|nr:hypothetical protein [Myxococcales bacterium]
MRWSLLGCWVACSGPGSETSTEPQEPPRNLPPVVELADVDVLVGEAVTLQPVVSDPEGDALTYVWLVRLQPPLSWFEIDDPRVEALTFTPDRVGPYVIDLMVSDGENRVTASSVILAGSGNVPSVQIEGSPVVAVSRPATLSAAGSSDPDNARLVFDWALLVAPAGSTLAVSSSGPELSFTPDQVGSYRLAVTVHNGSSASVAETTVEALPDPIVTGDVISGVLSPGQVYAYGNIGKGFCHLALAHWSDLDTVARGLDQCELFVLNEPVIGPEGAIHYLATDGVLRRLTCDDCPTSPGDGTTLVEEWLENDVVVGAPCGDLGLGSTDDFTLSPSGRLVVQCSSGGWFDDQGREVPGNTSLRPIYGDGDLALDLVSGELMDFVTGERVAVKGWPALYGASAGRVVKGGFWAAVGDELWLVDSDEASATKVGEYESLPPGLTYLWATALDADGAMIQVLYSEATFTEEIWRRRLDGVVYRTWDPELPAELYLPRRLVTGP